MNIRSGLSILGLSAALACGGGGGGSSYTPPPPPSGPPPNTVYVGGTAPYGGGTTMSFSPATLTVAKGTAVSFSWQGGTHTVTSYALNGSPTFPGVPSPGQSTGTYTYTFANAGTYYYYCAFHVTNTPNSTTEATGMAGKIVVQ